MRSITAGAARFQSFAMVRTLCLRWVSVMSAALLALLLSCAPHIAAAPYAFNWTSATTGTYSITARATEIIDMLAGHELSTDQTDYPDVLSILVEAYESEHHPLGEPGLRGLEVLQALLAEHGMRAADLARLLVVHRSMGAKLLKGERALTTRHLCILSARFKVSVDLFLKRGIIAMDNLRIASCAHGRSTHDHDTADPVS